MNENAYITVNEASKMFNVSGTAIRNYIKKELLKDVKTTRQGLRQTRLINVAELTALMTR